MFDDETSNAITGKSRDSSDEPAFFFRGVAGVLDGELFFFALYDSKKMGGNGFCVLGIGTDCRIAHCKIIGALADVAAYGWIGVGELTPSEVDGDDCARFVEDGQVRGKGIQCRMCEAFGFLQGVQCLFTH